MAEVQDQNKEEIQRKTGLALILDRIIYAVAILMGIYHLVAANYTIFQAGQHINIHITLSLVLVTLQAIRLKGNKPTIKGWLMILMLIASIITGVYIHIHYTDFMTSFGTPPLN